MIALTWFERFPNAKDFLVNYQTSGIKLVYMIFLRQDHAKKICQVTWCNVIFWLVSDLPSNSSRYQLGEEDLKGRAGWLA